MPTDQTIRNNPAKIEALRAQAVELIENLDALEALTPSERRDTPAGPAKEARIILLIEHMERHRGKAL